MSNDTHAVTTIPVGETCIDKDCQNDSEVSMIGTGEYGTDGVAAYCDDCAAERDDSDAHTAIGEVTLR